jgi:hypothetical protein
MESTKDILPAKICLNRTPLALAITYKILALYRKLVKYRRIDQAFHPRPTGGYKVDIILANIIH